MDAVQHFVLFVPRVGKVHVFQLHIGVPDVGALCRLGECGHFEKFFKVPDGELHLPHVFGEDLELCQRADHGHREHHGERRLRRGNAAAVCQRQRRRQRADQRGREQRKAEFHGGKGRGQPLDHKGAEVGDGARVFFIGNAGSAKRLNDLDALDVFNDRAVHVVCGFVVLCKVFAADFEGQTHADDRQRQRHKRGERQTPVKRREGDDADDRQDDMPRALGDHVRQRRLQVFDLVHHHALDLADGVAFHVAERRMQKPVGKAQAQPLQNGVCHAVRYARGEGEGQNFRRVCRKRRQTPQGNAARRHRVCREQADQPVHAVERHKPEGDRQDRQDDRQKQLFLLTRRIGKERVQKALLFRFWFHIRFLFRFSS